MYDEPAGSNFVVVVNDEEQYSIWETSRPVPAGWTAVIGEDTKEACLAYIDRVWTDMRPKSVRG
jgi:MbtH protein